MTIEVVSQQQALDRTAVSLGLRTGKITGNDLMPFLSQAVRRGALVLSPCGRGELEHAVFTTLGGLFAERETLAEQIEDAVENLLAFGDLLEMRAPSSESGRKSFVVRPAPFHYVVREDRSIVLLGTGIDEITPLSETLLKSIAARQSR